MRIGVLSTALLLVMIATPNAISKEPKETVIPLTSISSLAFVLPTGLVVQLNEEGSADKVAVLSPREKSRNDDQPDIAIALKQVADETQLHDYVNVAMASLGQQPGSFKTRVLAPAVETRDGKKGIEVIEVTDIAGREFWLIAYQRGPACIVEYHMKASSQSELNSHKAFFYQFLGTCHILLKAC